ncbi:hypothetical protein E3P77_02845 [Wallemia ichthyophaga]|nr:hypothetical protein E3P77_02845 [Wallemia ichthyophaga]
MSSPSRDEIKQAAAIKQGDIRIEKDSTAYAEYHPIERPAGVSNTGSMKYAQLVSFFDNITNEKNVSMRSLKLAKLFDYHREHYGNDFYNLLRLMIPERERERSMFGIKETVLAKIYVELLGLSPKHNDGHRLLSWKAPTAAHTVSGDFPSVLVDVMKNRVSYDSKSSFTIDEVNHKLDQLSRAKSFQQKKDIMKEFAKRCDTEEQFWLVRILLKNLKISIRERSILSQFHPDAYALFEVTTDLRTVAYRLYDPSMRLRDADSSVHLFQVFQPMLCKRNTIPDVHKKMPHGRWVVEEKMDGERIQLHRKGDRYKYWSRKAKDYTYLYGKSPTDGSLTPFIHTTFDSRVDEVVLDGEMLAYSGAIDAVLPFGTLKKAAKGDIGTHPIFKVFDVLWVNGKDISAYPFKERQKVLRSIFTELPTRFEHVSRWTVGDVVELKGSLERIILQKGEGLVVKSPLSTYEYGGRSDRWIKLKPDYFDEMSETADLLVIGGNWSNSRNGVISTLFCALVDDREENIAADPQYILFARAGTGYSAQDLVIINELFAKADTRKYTPASVYPGVKIGNETPDVVINPQQSFVVEIKASDINPSTQYPTGCTYRFPRFKRLRLDKGSGDKSPFDPDSLFKWTEMDSMIKGIKASRSHQAEAKVKEKQAKPTRASKKQVISSRAVASVRADTRNYRNTLFEGCAFRILNGTNELEVKDLAVLIAERKGMALSHIPRDEDCPEPLLVIAGKATAVQVSQLVKLQRRSILSAQWLLECVQYNCIVPLEGAGSGAYWVYQCDVDSQLILDTLRPFFITPDHIPHEQAERLAHGQLDLEAVGEINELRFTQKPALQVEEKVATIVPEEEDSETEKESLGESGDDGDETIQEGAFSAQKSPSPRLGPSQLTYTQTSSTRTVTRQKGSTSNNFDDSSDEGDDSVKIKKEATQLFSPTTNPQSPHQKNREDVQKEQPSIIRDDADPDRTLEEDAVATLEEEENVKTSGTTGTLVLNQQEIHDKVDKGRRRSRVVAFDSDHKTNSEIDVEDASAKKSKKIKQEGDSEEMHEHELGETSKASKQHESLNAADVDWSVDHPREPEVVEEAVVITSDDLDKPLLNVAVYVDDYENAITNDLFPRPSIMSKTEWVIRVNKPTYLHGYSWTGIRDKITRLGGMVAEVDDSRLTHIVIDENDKRRVEELFERTKR